MDLWWTSEPDKKDDLFAFVWSYENNLYSSYIIRLDVSLSAWTYDVGESLIFSLSREIVEQL